MKNKFLQAKHWQLFAIMFGIPFLFQIVLSISMILNIENSDPTRMIGILISSPIIMLLYMGFFFGWFWSMGIGLQKFIPNELKMKIRRFKIFFFIPLIYILLIFLGMGTAFFGISTGSNAIGEILGKMVFLILPIHLFSMFCMFYMLYFISKTIKTIELGRPVALSDFIGEFFLIWFFPIGIWFIQPRINTIVSGSNLSVGVDE